MLCLVLFSSQEELTTGKLWKRETWVTNGNTSVQMEVGGLEGLYHKRKNLHWCEKVNRIVSVSSNSRESCQMTTLFIKMKARGSSFSQNIHTFLQVFGEMNVLHSTPQNWSVSCEHLWLERVPKQSASERWKKMRNVTACEGRKSTKKQICCWLLISDKVQG